MDRGRDSAAPPRRKHGGKDVAATGPDQPTYGFPRPKTTPPVTHQHQIQSPEDTFNWKRRGKGGRREWSQTSDLTRRGKNSAPPPPPAGDSPPARSSPPTRDTRERRQPRLRRRLARKGRRPGSEVLLEGRSD